MGSAGRGPEKEESCDVKGKNEKKKKKDKIQGRTYWAKMQNAARPPVSHAKRVAPSAPATPPGNALVPRYHDYMSESEARNNCAVCADCFPEALRSHYSVM